MPEDATSRQIDFKRSHSPKPKRRGRSFLLVIGIDAYQYIRPLSNAVRDAQSLTRVLQDRYQFEEAYTTELYNQAATREEIFSAFDHLGGEVTEEDNLIIFYAGHGYYNTELEIGYWVPVDGKDGRSGTFIEHSAIRTYLRSIDSHHTFLIVDSCFSGNLLANHGRNASPVNVYADKVDRYPSRWCFAAGMIEEVSDGYIGDHSPFTQSLIDFLEHNEEPRLPIQELINKVSIATSYNAEQTPISGVIINTGSHTGQFVFDLKPDFMPESESRKQVSPGNFTQSVSTSGSDTQTHQEVAARKSSVGKLLKNRYIISGIIAGFLLILFLIVLIPKRENQLNTQTFIPLDTTPVSPEYVPDNMIFIQGGSFEMGDVFEEGEENERPVHTVIVNSFMLGKYEVSFAEYDEYCRSVNINPPSDAGWGRGDRPVIYVSWLDAIRYCNWLSKQTGLDTVYIFQDDDISANWEVSGFRLPTEAEWEFAARERGKYVRFGNGRDTADAKDLNFYSKAAARVSYSLSGPYRGKTLVVSDSTVGSNQLGLYHMSGNVWEWCWDAYGEDYYAHSPEQNPVGVSSSTERILRGGSWDDSPDLLRASNRDFLYGGSRERYIGFRIAKSP